MAKTKKLSPAQERELRRCSNRDVRVRGSLEKTYNILLEREFVKRSGFLLYTITDAGRNYLAALEPQPGHAEPKAAAQPKFQSGDTVRYVGRSYSDTHTTGKFSEYRNYEGACSADKATWITVVCDYCNGLHGWSLDAVELVTANKTTVMNADVATPAQYFSAKQQLIDTLRGETDMTTRDGIKLQIETLEAEWYNPPVPAFVMDEPPVSPEDTELAPAAPEMPEYEPLQPKVIIPVVIVPEIDTTRLEVENKQLRYELNSARQQVQDRLVEVFELQRKVLSYSMAQTTPAAVVGAGNNDVTLVDEITVERVTGGGKNNPLILSGHWTEDVQTGYMDGELQANIYAYREHKWLLILAGYSTMQPESIKGARILAPKAVNRRPTAVRGKNSNEWFSMAYTSSLKAGMTVINYTTNERRIVKVAKKDTRPVDVNALQNDEYFYIQFEGEEGEYIQGTKMWYVVNNPALVGEQSKAA